MSAAQQLLVRVAGRLVLARALHPAAGALGDVAGRSLHAAALPVAGLRRRASPICARAGLPGATQPGSPRTTSSASRCYGQVDVRGLELELRQALEPWHVMGEEPGAGGTARYVDSSVERVQVTVRGATDGRHVVTCNGRRVPLHPPARREEQVAGVRYRAWQPPSALHPTIGVHAPLVFDLVDTWSGRSLGGCTLPRRPPRRPQLRRPSPPTPWRPRAAAPPASSPSATPPARWTNRSRNATPSSPTRWTCGGHGSGQRSSAGPSP